MMFRFRSGPSRVLATFYGAVHLAAMFALLQSALPLAGLLLLLPWLAVHGTVLVRRALMVDGNTPAEVRADGTETLLELVNGRRIPVGMTGIYCTSWLQVVHFRRQGPGVGFWLVLLADTSDIDTRRALRAWLLTVSLRCRHAPEQDV